MAVRKKRAGYHHGDLRRAVVDAALDAIEKSGTESLSLRDLARRLGVSHQAPYRHFADKQALLAEIARTGFAKLVERLRAGPKLEADITTALIESGVNYVAFAVENPAYYRVMFATSGTPAHGHAAPMPQPGTAYELLTFGVARGQEAGQLPRGVPARDLALLCWTVVHGLAMLAIDGQLGSPAAAMATARDAIALQVRTFAVASRAR
jgi:AcrR family transcriptional regulator